MKTKRISASIVIGAAATGLAAAGTQPAIGRALNPICPPGVYIADPEARQMPDGRVYVYGSRDEAPDHWCSHSYDVLSSSDMIHWNHDQLAFATSGEGKQTDYTQSWLYAPDCIERDGTYYLYYCLADGGDDEGVATARSPYGPFGKGRKMNGARGIDPAVFVDDDGQAYLYWGQGSSKCAKLMPDMKSLDLATLRDGVIYHHDSKYSDNPAELVNTRDFWFNEGSSIRKRNGIYYYVYAQGGRHGRGCCACLAYATSRSPFGPFTYRGVIIDNFGSGPNLVNNHGCIAELNGKWYVFYHRPTHGTSTMRKACVEPIAFNADGTIPEVEMTTQGAGGPINPLERMDAARACLMSGHVRVTCSRPPSNEPVEYLASIKDGDSATWRYFDFTGKNVTGFTCKTLGRNLAGRIELHLDKADGDLIGTCDIAPGAENLAFAIHSAKMKPVTGVHALVMKFIAIDTDPKRPDLFNLDWFTFTETR
jgi:arabinoxylan arabinofuranohydrolase